MMVSKMESGSVPSLNEGQKCPFKLIASRKGKKLLVMDGYIFNLTTKCKTTAYFKCSKSRKKGCNARIILRNWDHNNYTFDGYEITNNEHVNHLPDPDKIKRRAEDRAKVISENVQVYNAPEFLNSKHVCLFCFSSLPPNYHVKTSILEIGPSGKELALLLDNPTKNCQAFDILCSLLNVKWRRHEEGRYFDQTIALPLCSNCQHLYQEVFQLHVQIRELEKMINKRIKFIRRLVERSDEKGRNYEMGDTQLALLGLDRFRKKVKDATFNQFGYDADENDTEAPTASITTLPPAPEDIVKQEVNSDEEGNFEGNYESNCMSEDEAVEDNQDNSTSASSKTEELHSTLIPKRQRTARLAGQMASKRFTVAAGPTSSDENNTDINYNSDNESNSDTDTQFTPSKNPQQKKPPPVCPHCSKEFPTQTILNNHLIASHGQVHNLNFYQKSGKPVKTLTCHLCDAKVTGQGPFLQHYKEYHPDEKRYTCKFCKRHFPYIREILEHQMRHMGKRPFKCDKCDQTFFSDKLLKIHKSRRHPDRPDAVGCSKCPKRFPCRRALLSHILIKHKSPVAFCKTCGRSFRSKELFVKHNEKVHGGTAKLSRPVHEPEKLGESLQNLGILDEDAEVKPQYKCHICWEPIQDKVFLQKHFDNHHPDHKGGVLTCKCGKRFKFYKFVERHAMRHDQDRKELHCDQCPHKMYSISEFNVHKNSHVTVEERRKNHVCDVCGLGLVSASALYKHRKRHEEDGKATRWVCEQCGKSYREKKGLVHHTKEFHLKILPWKCDTCGRAFAQRSLLKKHERIHLDYKPFKCEICEVAFVHSSSKLRHMREAHK